jgi:predicted Ser/Thr protein kinase
LRQIAIAKTEPGDENNQDISANPKDFRNEVVKFSLRSRAQNGGKNPSWTSYEKIREVIEKRIFSQVEKSRGCPV